jgi:hypothetical protein
MEDSADDLDEDAMVDSARILGKDASLVEAMVEANRFNL